MGFQQGLSGLNAASKDLDVVGNNVANAGTIGFKQSQAQFADVYASSLGGAGGLQIGIGAKVGAVAQQFSQGNISVTNSPLDLAVNGKGFFRVSQSGSITYTRNGQFQTNKDGYIVDSSGRFLTGFGTADVVDPATGQIKTIPNSGIELELRVDPTPDTAAATTEAGVALNLDAGSSAPSVALFNYQNPLSYSFSTSAQIYDSLGNARPMALYFVKTAVPGEWDMHASVAGTDPNNVNLGAGAGLPVKVNFTTSGALTSVNGVAAATATTVTMDLTGGAFGANTGIVGATNGATATQALTLDLIGSAQFAGSFSVNSLSVDGNAPGSLTGYSFGSDGALLARYSNGNSRTLGFLRLENFAAPQGLLPQGDNQWAISPNAGSAIPGTPGTGSFGLLQSASLEDSNVDLTAELVRMITAQRAYQANAQTIKTQDQVLQTLVNLR